jgi:hypothetical protein
MSLVLACEATERAAIATTATTAASGSDNHVASSAIAGVARRFLRS